MKYMISFCLAVMAASGGAFAQQSQAVSALGRLEPLHGIIHVAAASTPDAVSGAVLVELHVEEGDDLRKGDLVLVYSPGAGYTQYAMLIRWAVDPKGR